MAPSHNLNLFDLFTKKKMENAMKRDRRVKRLQAEMTRRRGVKIAAYSTSLLLEENLTVEDAADVICKHLDENKQQKEAIPKDDYDSSPPRTLRNESNSSNEQSRTFVNMLKSGSQTNKRTVDPAVVTAVIQEMMPKLLPTIVEGVVASMQKD
nr:PREDICTED: uncharacterized protein LOC109041145 isoform X2 [Bemisia tabaci]